MEATLIDAVEQHPECYNPQNWLYKDKRRTEMAWNAVPAMDGLDSK